MKAVATQILLGVIGTTLVLGAFEVLTPLMVIRFIGCGVLLYIVTAAIEGVRASRAVEKEIRQKIAYVTAEFNKNDAALKEQLRKADAALDSLTRKTFTIGTAEEEIHPGDRVQIDPATGRLSVERAKPTPMPSGGDDTPQ